MEKSRFLHPYYILNSLLLISYVALRMKHISSIALSQQDMFGITREATIYFCLSLMLFVRALSSPTFDVYISAAFSYCRITILVCLYHMHWKFFIIFLGLWTLIYAVCPQPLFRLPSSVANLTSPSFHERITRNTHQTIYILWCHAPWSSRCSQLTPVFATLVRRYDHPRIIFARINVSRFSDIADKLGVSISPTSKQLPCVIAFKQGKEVARVPIVNERGHIEKTWLHGFTAAQLDRALDLPNLFATAVKWEKEAQRRYEKKKD